MSRFHPGMDVFTADQTRYIGSVTRVLWKRGNKSAGAGPAQTGSAREDIEGTTGLVHEEGASQSPTEHIGTQMLGEEMGPVPTIQFGNHGPERQSAGQHYATAPHDDDRQAQYLVVRPGRINLGILTPPLWIPINAVRSISMERVVLDVEDESSMPIAWRVPPAFSAER